MRTYLDFEKPIAELESKIEELTAMRSALRLLVHRCHAGVSLECPIIEALDD